MRRFHLLVALLAAACVAASAQETGERARLNPLARFEPGQLAETLRRPLFSASRRPPPPPPTAALRDEAPPPPPEPPRLTLMGVVTDWSGARALVKTGPPIRMRSLRRDDEIEGWRVVEIAPRRVVFGRDARRHVVALFASPVRPAIASPLPDASASEGD